MWKAGNQERNRDSRKTFVRTETLARFATRIQGRGNPRPAGFPKQLLTRNTPLSETRESRRTAAMHQKIP